MAEKIQKKLTKEELKMLFPACAEIWDLEFEEYCIVTLQEEYVTIDDKNGNLIFEGSVD